MEQSMVYIYKKINIIFLKKTTSEILAGHLDKGQGLSLTKQ